MKGLFLKDWYLSAKYYKPYFLVLFVFAGVSIWSRSNPFLISYPLMLVSMMAPGLQNIDEGCRWDMYCGTMPCTKKQIVSEKYLFGLVWAAIGLVTVVLSQLIRMRLNGGIVWTELLYVLTLCLFLIFFLPSISLPFVFKYGAEKGRIAQYLIIGCVCGGAAIVSMQQNDVLPQGEPGGAGNLLLVLGAAAVYALSWLLSIRFYEKREVR